MDYSKELHRKIQVLNTELAHVANAEEDAVNMMMSPQGNQTPGEAEAAAKKAAEEKAAAEKKAAEEAAAKKAAEEKAAAE